MVARSASESSKVVPNAEATSPYCPIGSTTVCCDVTYGSPWPTGEIDVVTLVVCSCGEMLIRCLEPIDGKHSWVEEATYLSTGDRAFNMSESDGMGSSSIGLNTLGKIMPTCMSASNVSSVEMSDTRPVEVHMVLHTKTHSLTCTLDDTVEGMSHHS